MARITKTELNQQTARVLARVAAGERLTVTDRGRPIAEISPASPTRWEELIASGRVTPPRESGALTGQPVELDVPIANLLGEVRADRG